MQRTIALRRNSGLLLTGTLLLGGLLLTRLYSYVLFHSLAEMFGIAISCAVFILAWNTRRHVPNDYLLFVGIALLFAAMLNLVHTLAYRGMGVFTGNDANLATQVWIARRYIESIALLVAPLFLTRRLNTSLTLFGCAAVTTLVLVSIFAGVFPDAYIEGAGLTTFKKVSEYAIALVFLGGALHLYRHRAEFGSGVARVMIWALLVAAVAELLFTLYTGVYDLPNLLGHVLMIVSYYLIYRAILSTGLVRPYRLLNETNCTLRAEVTERQRVEHSLRQTAQALAEREGILQQQSLRLQGLHEIDRAILTAQSVVDIAQVAASHLRQLIQCARVSVVLFDHEHGVARSLAVDQDSVTELGPGRLVPLTVFGVADGRWPAQAEGVADLAALANRDAGHEALLAEGIRYTLSLPLVFDQRSIGAINLGARAITNLSLTAQDIARQVADSLAVAIANAHLNEEVRTGHAQLQHLSHRLVMLQEEERRAVAAELYDDAGQILAALGVGLNVLERQFVCSEEARSQLKSLKQMAEDAMIGLHRLGSDLRPASLDKLGLPAALRQYTEHFAGEQGVPVDCVIANMEGQRLAPETETGVYRIVQEALANAVQHACAKHIAVMLLQRDGYLTALVEDDGTGFDPQQAEACGTLGLLSMRERASMLGGKVTIESVPGRGTTVFIEVPLT